MPRVASFVVALVIWTACSFVTSLTNWPATGSLSSEEPEVRLRSNGRSDGKNYGGEHEQCTHRDQNGFTQPLGHATPPSTAHHTNKDSPKASVKRPSPWRTFRIPAVAALIPRIVVNAMRVCASNNIFAGNCNSGTKCDDVPLYAVL